MALTNADNPVSEPAAKTAAKPEPALRLGRVGESGDAGVHNLLAQRHVHVSNGDDAAVKAIDDQLAELGFAV